MRGFSIAELKEIFQDDTIHLECGLITSLEVAEDRSVLRCGVSVLPEGTQIEARMTWEMVGPDYGLFQFPSVNDLVIVGFCDGNEDEAYILKRLTSKEDTIPVRAVDGQLVLAARPGTQLDLNSDTQINLTRQGEGDERLVLGDTFKPAYSEHLQIDAGHDHIGNLGYKTSPPSQAADYLAIKAEPVDNEAMLSDLSKTEK